MAPFIKAANNSNSRGLQNKKDIVRWLLVIPFAFIGWYVALFIGIILYSIADSFCPPELMLSDSCQASWHEPLIEGLIIFGSSLSAVLVILFSAIVAPSKRVLVAKTIYIGGVIFAVYAAYETSAWSAFFGAVLSGAIFLYLLIRYIKRKNHA